MVHPLQPHHTILHPIKSVANPSWDTKSKYQSPAIPPISICMWSLSLIRHNMWYPMLLSQSYSIPHNPIMIHNQTLVCVSPSHFGTLIFIICDLHQNLHFINMYALDWLCFAQTVNCLFQLALPLKLACAHSHHPTHLLPLLLVGPIMTLANHKCQLIYIILTTIMQSHTRCFASNSLITSIGTSPKLSLLLSWMTQVQIEN